jgi:hypothetical protein
MSRFHLPDALAQEVLAAIGAHRPSDATGVAELYRRFCAAIPFDPVMKAVAIREGTQPPGADPAPVAERYLATGIGGTCWATCGVLAALLGHAGIDATIALERMLDIAVVDFHCFTVAVLDDEPVALDPVHVSGDPLPLRVGPQGTHPTYRAEFDADDLGRLEHTWRGPEHGGRYVVLSQRLDSADVAAFCDVSVQHTGVRARRLFQRTATPEAIRIVRPTDDGLGLRVREWTAATDGARAAGEPGGGDDTTDATMPRTSEARHPAEILEALRTNETGMDLVVRSGLAVREGDGWRFTT